MNKILTIFTPTYNRAYTLSELYRSLSNQTNKDFSWYIIDDGSIDETEQIVNKWIDSSDIEIIYHHVKNGGKQRAINLATNNVNSEYLFIVDSDDQLTHDAVDTIYKWINETRELPYLAGFAGLKGNLKGDRIKNKWMNPQKEYIDAYNTERKSLNLLEDKAEVFKLSILKNYSFRIHPKEKFIPENYVLDAISHDGFKFRWYNQTIYLCDYIEDGYTQNGKKIAKNNTRSYAIMHNARANRKHNLLEKLLEQTKAIAFMTFHWDFSELRMSSSKSIVIIALPLGILFGIIKQVQWRNL